MGCGKLPGSFQTHFSALRPINQGYICVGPLVRGEGVEKRRLGFCLYMHPRFVFMLPVRVHGVDGSRGSWVCFVRICQRRQEQVVDAGLIPALRSK